MAGIHCQHGGAAKRHACLLVKLLIESLPKCVNAFRSVCTVLETNQHKSQYRNMAGYGWILLDMARYGWILMDMDGHGCI